MGPGFLSGTRPKRIFPKKNYSLNNGLGECIVRKLFSRSHPHTMTIGTMATNGFTVWFTGMSLAGKSTLAQALANRLKRLGETVEILDGAEVEQMLGVGKAGTK